MKQFVKALDKSSPFEYLVRKFPMLPSIFDIPRIPKLIKDADFRNIMTDLELQAWDSYRDVINKFISNVKDYRYEHIVKNMLEYLKQRFPNCSLLPSESS